MGRLAAVPPIRHPLFDPKHPGRRQLPPFPPSPLDENEQVVLVDEEGRPIGVADKATVTVRTPPGTWRSPATVSGPTAGYW